MVDTIARNEAGTGTSGLPHASDPFREKCVIVDLLASPDLAGDERILLTGEYNRLTARLDKCLDNTVYRECMVQDLRRYIHEYSAGVCRARIGQAGPDIDDFLSVRALIGELCSALRTGSNLSGAEALIAMLDRNLPPEGMDEFPMRSRKCIRFPPGTHYPVIHSESEQISPTSQ
jgi:hypothetical protein